MQKGQIILTKQKYKVVQSYNNSLGQQHFGCQGYGHLRTKYPTYLRSKGKVMAVPLSDDERTDHESESDHEGNFMAFTTIAIVGEIETLDENQSDG